MTTRLPGNTRYISCVGGGGLSGGGGVSGGGGGSCGGGGSDYGGGTCGGGRVVVERSFVRYLQIK